MESPYGTHEFVRYELRAMPDTNCMTCLYEARADCGACC